MIATTHKTGSWKEVDTFMLTTWGAEAEQSPSELQVAVNNVQII